MMTGMSTAASPNSITRLSRPTDMVKVKSPQVGQAFQPDGPGCQAGTPDQRLVFIISKWPVACGLQCIFVASPLRHTPLPRVPDACLCHTSPLSVTCCQSLPRQFCACRSLSLIGIRCTLFENDATNPCNAILNTRCSISPH